MESLKETKKVKADKINTHNKSEPSWFPHTPLILYINGFKVCELFETINKEKSEVIKLNVKITKDKKTDIWEFSVKFSEETRKNLRKIM